MEGFGCRAVYPREVPVKTTGTWWRPLNLVEDALHDIHSCLRLVKVDIVAGIP